MSAMVKTIPCKTKKHVLTMEKTIIEPKTMVNVQLSKFPGKLNMKPMALPCGL